MIKKEIIKVKTAELQDFSNGNSRRKFLKIGGLAMAGTSLLLYSCSEDDEGMPIMADAFDLGSGDLEF